MGALGVDAGNPDDEGGEEEEYEGGCGLSF